MEYLKVSKVCQSMSIYICLKVCGPPPDHHHVGGGKFARSPRCSRTAWSGINACISHVFPQSVHSITMVSQTTRYVSCSCFWQTIHLEGRGCWVQNHGVDCQHGGGNLMLYTSRYHDINTYIYIYMDTPTWHIADLGTVGQGLRLSAASG